MLIIKKYYIFDKKHKMLLLFGILLSKYSYFLVTKLGFLKQKSFSHKFFQIYFNMVYKILYCIIIYILHNILHKFAQF